MYFKPRLSRERKRPIIWMASHHSLTSSTSSSFCISQNDFFPSHPTIQIQNYQNILGLSLKIEVRDKKNSESAERTTIRSSRMFTFSPRALRERKTKHFIIVYKSVLSVFTQEFSLVVWLRVRPENEPKKIWSVPIFLGLSDRPKKKIRSSATPPLAINLDGM